MSRPEPCPTCGALPCDQVAGAKAVHDVARELAWNAAIEAAAQIAENFTRANRDWVRDSLWDGITKGIAASIRARATP